MARYLHSISCLECGTRWRLAEPWPIGESTDNYIEQVTSTHTKCPGATFRINEIERPHSES